MPTLQYLDGRPQTWAELHERVRAFYTPPPLARTASERAVERAFDLLSCGEWVKLREIAQPRSYEYGCISRALTQLAEDGEVERRRDESVRPTFAWEYRIREGVMSST